MKITPKSILGLILAMTLPAIVYLLGNLVSVEQQAFMYSVITALYVFLGSYLNLRWIQSTRSQVGRLAASQQETYKALVNTSKRADQRHAQIKNIFKEVNAARGKTHSRTIGDIAKSSKKITQTADQLTNFERQNREMLVRIQAGADTAAKVEDLKRHNLELLVPLEAVAHTAAKVEDLERQNREVLVRLENVTQALTRQNVTMNLVIEELRQNPRLRNAPFLTKGDINKLNSVTTGNANG